MGKVIKDLALALINATLILVALCLFLLWRVTSTVDHVTENIANAVGQITPVANGVQAIRGELSAINTSLAALKDGSPLIDTTALAAQVARVEQTLNGIETQIADIRALPETLVDHAITTGVDRAATHVVHLRGCAPVEDPLS